MGSHSLNSGVLVLNKYFQAVQITTVRRAFSLFFKGVVKAVDESYYTYNFKDWRSLPPNGDMVRTPSYALRVPRVIQLLWYDKIPQFKIRFTRKNIFLRDRHLCQYCGNRFEDKDLTLDHVIPTSRGGRNSWENVVTCCFSCNNLKGNQTPAQAGMSLVRPPKRPQWIPFSRFARHRNSFSQWKTFIDLAYCTFPADYD